MIYRHLIIFYLLLTGSLSIVLFLYGFFPLQHPDSNRVSTRDDVPKYIENVRMKTDVLYAPVINKLIIMVIDALRWDFISAMPTVTNLIKNNSAYLSRAKLQAPTVTLPRIKAISSGTVPGFVDVVQNFGGRVLMEDNILLQAKNHGHKIIFFGDDTWLRLFPDTFQRYDGVTSFFVSDFTEVDNNVTRHLDHELKKDDWSIMILHYLGLDHIGHVYGPYHPLIKQKLEEMDNIVERIYQQTLSWNENSIPSSVLICGDHGMKNSGGHGGSTIEETTVPVVIVGGLHSTKPNDQPNEMAQVDITATLSVLLGIPIPSSNLGSIVLDALDKLSPAKKLFILNYNAKEVFNNFQKISHYQSTYAYEKYLKAIRLHGNWLKIDNQSEVMTQDVISTYKIALKSMKDILITSMTKYDFNIMTIAIIFLFQITCISLSLSDKIEISFQMIKFCILMSTSLGSWFFMNYYSQEGDYSSLDLTSIATLLFVSILIINCYLLASIECPRLCFHHLSTETNGSTIFFLPTILHAISLSSTSFVEEEHQTWYYFFQTYLILSFYFNIQRISNLKFNNYEKNSLTKMCIYLSLLMIAHRVLRKLNSTGDKYANLPDISGWLMNQDNRIALSILLIFALGLLCFIDLVHGKMKYKNITLIFDVVISMCIYIRHAIKQIVTSPFDFGILNEIQIFWILQIIFLVFVCKFNKNSLNLVLYLIVKTWIMISAMLHQPYNVILLPMQLMAHYGFHRLSFNCQHSVYEIIFTHILIGNTFYFYQGNSNSIATIDITAGYVGLESYKPIIIGLFLIVNTYSAPVISYLMLLYNVTNQNKNSLYQRFLSISPVYMSSRLIPITLFTIVISIQRYHLFIWTVFAPKLLYESMHSVVMYSIILCTFLIFTIHKFYT